MIDKYPTQEEVKILKVKQDKVFGKDYELGLEKIQEHVMYKTLETKKNNRDVYFILSGLWGDKDKSISFIEAIEDFCWEYEINLKGLLIFCIGFDYSEAIRLSKKTKVVGTVQEENYFNAINNYKKEDVVKIIYEKFEEIISLRGETLDLGSSPNTFQQVLLNSYDEVKKQVLKTIDIVKPPLEQYRKDPLRATRVLNEIEEEKRTFENILINNKSLSQIKNGNAFFSYLENDKIKITDDYKLIFEGHTKALSLGYTQKAIIVSLDKDNALRELRGNLKVLKKYHNDSEELIELTNTLIELIEQKKYSNMVPFKALAKEMNITKNQAKQYAKKLTNLFTIKNSTFDNNFEKIKLYDFNKS